MFNRIASSFTCTSAIALVGVASTTVNAQLTPEQVLVIYDRNFTESVQIAEYYAGSAKVPGGVGGVVGKRPDVKVFDLRSSGAPGNTFPDLNYTQFVNQVRNPIRTWLTANDPKGLIRCIVLCPRIPHRIFQASPMYAGDSPVSAGSSYAAGTYTTASIDSELTLLWQELGGETAVAGGTKATGMILNPYWRSTVPISGYTTINRTAAKTFNQATTVPATTIGKYWTANTLDPKILATPTNLAPGDVYLVCRLDGPSVAAIKGMIDRAQQLVVNVNTASFVMDESGASAVTDSTANTEYDNQGENVVYGGDDYEQTRDAIIADNRFVAAKVRYNASSGANSFVVGPLISYGGQGLIVSDPLLLLSSYGANSSFPAPGESPDLGTNVRTTYATSFNLAPGAVFTSMESFNGRDFWNLGQAAAFPQQQAAAFLAAGGTFAIGNTWEPFTFSMPDDLQLAKNFFLGNLSWGEAAYSALPGLSFQQIVLGDPLARVVRSSDDLDGDNRITIEDLYGWFAATTTRQDLNRSGTVTDADRKFVEDGVRSSRDTDMRGTQR